MVFCARWKLNRTYCFLRFFLKCMRVCVKVFSITVACTSTKPGCTRGRPIKEKSFPPASSTWMKKFLFQHFCLLSNVEFTLSKRILSPMFGGQKPSTKMMSPEVILNCLPHKCTTANRRPSFCRDSWSFTFSITLSLVWSDAGVVLLSIIDETGSDFDLVDRWFAWRNTERNESVKEFSKICRLMARSFCYENVFTYQLAHRRL